MTDIHKRESIQRELINFIWVQYKKRQISEGTMVCQYGIIDVRLYEVPRDIHGRLSGILLFI